MVVGRQEILAEYTRIAAEALGRDRLLRVPITELPIREPEERTHFWRRSENPRRHVLYAIRLARLVAKRYDLPLEGFGDFCFLDLKGAAAGRVTTQAASYFIELDEKYRDDPIATFAILAHEFAHVFLAQRSVSLPLERQNEELTDTVASLAGFGPIMIAACERVRSLELVFFSVQTTQTLGYLKRDDFAWLVDIQRRISSGQPFRVWSRGDPEWRNFSPCPACRSKLRLPHRSGKILLTCPVCGLVQDIYLTLGARRSPRALAMRLTDWVLRRFDTYNGVPE